MSEIERGRVDNYDTIELHGDKLIATIAPGYGGCLSSLKILYNNEWVELMYDANVFGEKVMGGRSPVLFPALGPSVLNGERNKYRHRDKIYQMPQHGFAKDAKWEVVDEGADEASAYVTLELKSTDEWREKSYPYDFILRITYKLKGDTLLTSSEVSNKSDRLMPFALGFHPYFKTPVFSDRATRNDCTVRIPGKTYFRMLPDGPTGEILALPEKEPLSQGVVPPDYHWVRIVNDLDTMEDGRTQCEIRDNGANISVFLQFDPEHFETATAYAPVDSEFVCVEPRTGIPMSLSDDTPARPTGKFLSPAGEDGDSITLDWTIRVAAN